jgi:hypothetical protein
LITDPVDEMEAEPEEIDAERTDGSDVVFG